MVSAFIQVIPVETNIPSNYLITQARVRQSHLTVATELFPLLLSLLAVGQTQMEVLVAVLKREFFLQSAFFELLQISAQHAVHSQVLMGQSEEIVCRDVSLVVPVSEVQSEVLHPTGVPKDLRPDGKGALLEVLSGENFCEGIEPNMSGTQRSLQEVVVLLQVEDSSDAASVKLELRRQSLDWSLEFNTLDGVGHVLSITFQAGNNRVDFELRVIGGECSIELGLIVGTVIVLKKLLLDYSERRSWGKS